VTGERDQWLARDGVWRRFETDPPAFAGEVVETRRGDERPLPGDDGYIAWLEGEYDAGRVDVTEATRLLYLHDEIVRAREAQS
jgi:hypothetical protein